MVSTMSTDRPATCLVLRLKTRTGSLSCRSLSRTATPRKHLRCTAEDGRQRLCSRGFNIEGSHVRDRERMSNMFSIIMVAYVWCYLVGIFIHENIRSIKTLAHGRKAVSLFKYGLDCIQQSLLNHTDRYRIDVFKFLSYT